MKVDIEHIRYLDEERKKINEVKLEDIEFYENGVKVDIDPKILEKFQFIGLNNINFISDSFYKGIIYTKE